MDTLGVIILPQLVKNNFLVSLPKKQQADMVQTVRHDKFETSEPQL